MTEDERRRLGQSRRFAFENLANGVPEAKICEDLKLSAAELEQARRFVARKITEHLFLRRQPPIACDSLRWIRWNRVKLLAVLGRIGDLDLSSDLILSRLTVQAMDHPEMIEGASRTMAEAYSR